VTRRKSGGREARIALRSTPLTEEEKPVKPGEIGGRYKPLSDKQVQAIEVMFTASLKKLALLTQLRIVLKPVLRLVQSWVMMADLECQKKWLKKLWT